MRYFSFLSFGLLALGLVWQQRHDCTAYGRIQEVGEQFKFLRMDSVLLRAFLCARTVGEDTGSGHLDNREKYCGRGTPSRRSNSVGFAAVGLIIDHQCTVLKIRNTGLTYLPAGRKRERDPTTNNTCRSVKQLHLFTSL